MIPMFDDLPERRERRDFTAAYIFTRAVMGHEPQFYDTAVNWICKEIPSIADYVENGPEIIRRVDLAHHTINDLLPNLENDFSEDNAKKWVDALYTKKMGSY